MTPALAQSDALPVATEVRDASAGEVALTEQEIAFCKARREGASLERAAQLVGVCERTGRRWNRRVDIQQAIGNAGEPVRVLDDKSDRRKDQPPKPAFDVPFEAWRAETPRPGPKLLPDLAPESDPPSPEVDPPTKTQVRDARTEEIKAALARGETGKAVAKRLGVSEALVSYAKTGARERPKPASFQEWQREQKATDEATQPAPDAAQPDPQLPAGSDLQTLLGLLQKLLGAGGAAVATLPKTSLTIREVWVMYERAVRPLSRNWNAQAYPARVMLEALGNRQIATLTMFDLDAFRQYLRTMPGRLGRPVSAATRNNVIGRLLRLMNWSVERGLLPANPLAATEMEHTDCYRKTVLKDADVDKILATAKDDVLLRTLVILLYDTGMRRAEALRLRWNQVDQAGRCVHLDAQDTKTGYARSPKLTKRAMDALLALPKNSPWVFGFEVGRCPDEKYITRIYARFRHAVDAAGLVGVGGERIVLHTLRHSFVARARRLHIPERIVMKQTGHRTRFAFDHYAAVIADEEVGAAMDKIESATPGLAATEVRHAS